MWQESATADAPHDHQHAMRRESSTGPRAGPFGARRAGPFASRCRYRGHALFGRAPWDSVANSRTEPWRALGRLWATHRRPTGGRPAGDPPDSGGMGADVEWPKSRRTFPAGRERTSTRFGPPPRAPACDLMVAAVSGRPCAWLGRCTLRSSAPTDQRRSGSGARLTGRADQRPPDLPQPGATPTSSPGRRPPRGPGP